MYTHLIIFAPHLHIKYSKSISGRITLFYYIYSLAVTKTLARFSIHAYSSIPKISFVSSNFNEYS